MQLQPMAAAQSRSFLHGSQATFCKQGVAGVCLQGLQSQGLGRQVWQKTNVAQQQQLKGTQQSCDGVVQTAGQHLDGLAVGVKQSGMRVVTCQQAQQEFIQVIARQQCLATGHDMATRPLGTLQGANFSVAAITKRQGLQGQQHGTQIGGGAFSSLGDQGHPPVVTGEDFQNAAGFAPVIVVEHKSGFIQNPERRSFTRSQSCAPAPRHRPSPSALSPTVQ